MIRFLPMALVLGAVTSSVAAAPVPFRFCAPGYPGTTDQAAPTMDRFARALETATGLPAGAVEATYDETEAGAVEAVKSATGGVAIVTLPFWLAYREELTLRPVLLAVPRSGELERWSLVAPKGRVSGPSDLHGWEVSSIAGYAPRFVRGPVLSAWGALPEDVAVTFTARVLGALRRTARGQQIAVVLDGAQTEGVEKLPFAEDLEIVTRSAPMPSTIVCMIGRAESPAIRNRLVEALTTFADEDTLDTLRLEGFREIPEGSLDGLVEAFESVADGP
jgi:hypothetical protein